MRRIEHQGLGTRVQIDQRGEQFTPRSAWHGAGLDQGDHIGDVDQAHRLAEPLLVTQLLGEGVGDQFVGRRRRQAPADFEHPVGTGAAGTPAGLSGSSASAFSGGHRSHP